MNNQEIAQLFREVAAAYTIKDENRFKIIAYERAADTIEHLSQELQDVWSERKLQEIPGIGANIASHLNELFKNGSVKHFEVAKKGLPKAMFILLKLPGFGAKRAFKLSSILKIKDSDPIEQLEKAALKHKIADIEGFGEKSEQEILQAIEAYRKKQAKLTRMVLPKANQIAQNVITYLREAKAVIQVQPLGSLRRMAATVGDIDIAVSTSNPAEVLNHFIKYPQVKKIIEKGETTSSILLKSGVQIDLMIQPPESFGSLLQHLTGSKLHNIKLREYAQSHGMSLSEYGIRKIQNPRLHLPSARADGGQAKSKIQKFRTEKEFYQALGMEWIPPELREDSGEIEAALRRGLPKLAELSDIKGDLHIHSNYNLEPSHDLGENTFMELLQKADNLGYDYLCFSEHNPSIAKHSKTQVNNILKSRKSIIDKLKYSTKFTRVNILNMMEVDILPDGQLAVPASFLDYIEAIIISVHSSFNQTKEEMTSRIITALNYPKVKILGHPTCRILEKREAINADWEKIFIICQQKKIALEINANPYRLDLPDTLIRVALAKNCKFIISTDAHRVSEMDLMLYGIAVARRGWLAKHDILNTLPYNEFREWLMGK